MKHEARHPTAHQRTFINTQPQQQQQSQTVLSSLLQMPSLLKLVHDLRCALNTAIDLEKEFKEDDKFINDLKIFFKIEKIGFINATGGALHRLYESKPSIDAVNKLIKGCPDALSFKYEIDQLPAWVMDAVKHIPVLAKEGIKHEVGGRGMRGGLLLADPTMTDNWNTLQLTVRSGISSDPIPYDTASLDVSKELRKYHFLLKEDIKDQHLLPVYRSYFPFPQSKMRFKYLAEWDPDCLMTDTYKDLPLSQAIIG